MFPPILTPKRFLEQNQLLKKDKWFYLDWHEQKKSSRLKHTHHHPLTQLISLHLRPSHWHLPALLQRRVAMRLNSRQWEKREAIFVTSRYWPTAILVCLLHVPLPSTVWTWEGKVNIDELSSSGVLARLCITKHTYLEPHSTTHHQQRVNVLGARSLKLEDVLDTAAGVTNSMMWWPSYTDSKELKVELESVI